MESYVFSDIFDIGVLQELADSLSDALRAEVGIWSPQGEPLIQNRKPTRFHCDVLGNSPAGNALNEQHIANLCALGGPYPHIRLCQVTGLAGAVASVLVEGAHVANVVAGPVRLCENKAGDDDCRRAARSLQIDENLYLDAVHQLPVMTAAQFRCILSAISLLMSQFGRLGHENLRLRSAVSSLENQMLLHQREKNVLETLAERDSLTRLYNRRKFEETVEIYSRQTDRQICMISADANFLKLTNDIFGHESGDLLIKAIAKIMDDLAKSDWMVTRGGGDEFYVILPDTSLETALDYCRRVARNCSHNTSLTLPLSVALGAAEWNSASETLMDCFSRADAKMYQNKTALKHELRIPDYIMERLYDRQILDKAVVAFTEQLTYDFALYLGFPQEQAGRIGVAAHYQDIGMAKLPESLVIRGQSRTEVEVSQIHMHATHGYTMARQFDELYKIADIIHCSHENWDGTGYPSGLQGEAIPLDARIIHIIYDYTRRTHPTVTGGYYTETDSRQKLADGSGSIYDAGLVTKFLAFLDHQAAEQATPSLSGT